jgi:hypothetical protein
MQNNVVFIDNRPNQLPKELEKELDKLKPGQVVRLMINPARQKNVKATYGTDNNVGLPQEHQSIRSMRNGAVSLSPNRWTLNYDGKDITVGFLERLDANGAPVWSTGARFNPDGVISLSGDDPGHREIYRIAQIAPYLKDGKFARKNNPNWLFRIEKPGESAQDDSILAEFDRTTFLQNTISTLDDEQLSILVSGYQDGLNFYAKPDIIGLPKAIKAFLVSRIQAKQYEDLENKLSDLAAFCEIEFIKKALDEKDLIISGNKIAKKDGTEIDSTPDAPNTLFQKDVQGQAKYIFENCKNTPDFREALSKLIMGYAAKDVKLASKAKLVK